MEVSVCGVPKYLFFSTLGVVAKIKSTSLFSYVLPIVSNDLFEFVGASSTYCVGPPNTFQNSLKSSATFIFLYKSTPPFITNMSYMQ